MVRDPGQEGARENAAKADGILPKEVREIREALDQAEAEEEARVKVEAVAVARVEAEVPAKAVVTDNNQWH